MSCLTTNTLKPSFWIPFCTQVRPNCFLYSRDHGPGPPAVLARRTAVAAVAFPPTNKLCPSLGRSGRGNTQNEPSCCCIGLLLAKNFVLASPLSFRNRSRTAHNTTQGTELVVRTMAQRVAPQHFEGRVKQNNPASPGEPAAVPTSIRCTKHVSSYNSSSSCSVPCTAVLACVHRVVCMHTSHVVLQSRPISTDR